MHRLTSLTVFLLAATLLASCSKGPGGKSGGTYADAMKAVGEHHFDTADSLLAGLAKTDPEGYSTTYGQGFSFENQLLFCDALESYLLTVSRYPDSGAALAALSRAFTLLGAQEEAVEATRRWSQAEKGNNEARFRLIRAQIEAGMYQKAEQSLDEARKVGLDKGVGDLIEARLQVLSHANNEGARKASEAKSEGTESPDLLLALADYYEEQGLIDSAVQAGNKAFELTHEVFYGYLNFQRCLKHQYFTDARAFIASLALDDKRMIPATAATLQYKVAASERAQLSRLADQLERLRPGRYTPLFIAINVRECLGDYSMAHQHSVDIRTLYSQQGVYPPFKAFLHWYGFNPSFTRWPYPPADVMGELDSLRGWREVLPRFQAMAAGAFLRDTSLTRFSARVDSLTAANASNPAWLAALGLTFSESEGIGRQTGNKVLNLVFRKDPQSIAARSGLVNNAVADFNYADALAIIAGDPTFVDRCPEAGLRKALCEVMAGKSADAVVSFQKSYPLVKGEISRVEEIAMALLHQGKTSEAQQIVARCLELSPKDPDAYLVGSDLQYQLGNAQQSLDLAEKGIQLEPHHGLLKSYRARALYALGQKDEAKKIFTEILTKVPNDPEASQIYSRILADENVELERAQNLARQAQVFGKISSRPTINLAYVYIKAGRYDLALGAAQQAVTIYPNDPEAYYYLGMAMFYGKRPGAKESLQKAIALGLSGDYLKTARESLNKI